MNEVTIVTAFFDVGRKSFKGNERSNQKYYDYFKFWARIQNNLIVYTDTEESAKEIKKIRKEFGREKQTKVIIIKDIYSIEPDIYKRMVEVLKSESFAKYRYMPNSAENNPNYNYIMMLKSYLISLTVKKYGVKGMIAWLDFGFNHGGTSLSNPKEFNFLWKTNAPKDKITHICPIKDDKKPIFQIIESYDVYAWGFIILMPANLSEHYYELIKGAMTSLLDCDFIDDDQTLMLMASRKEPKLFNYIYSNSFEGITKLGADQLTLIDKSKQKGKLKDRVLRPYRIVKRNHKMHKNMKELFDKDYLD